MSSEPSISQLQRDLASAKQRGDKWKKNAQECLHQLDLSDAALQNATAAAQDKEEQLKSSQVALQKFQADYHATLRTIAVEKEGREAAEKCKEELMGRNQEAENHTRDTSAEISQLESEILKLREERLSLASSHSLSDDGKNRTGSKDPLVMDTIQRLSARVDKIQTSLATIACLPPAKDTATFRDEIDLLISAEVTSSQIKDQNTVIAAKEACQARIAQDIDPESEGTAAPMTRKTGLQMAEDSRRLLEATKRGSQGFSGTDGEQSAEEIGSGSLRLFANVTEALARRSKA